VRIRSLAKAIVYCALSVCAMHYMCLWAFGTLAFSNRICGIHADLPNINEQPTVFSPPASSEHLFKLVRFTGSDALRFSYFAYKTTSVVGDLNCADVMIGKTLFGKTATENIHRFRIREPVENLSFCTV